MGRTQSVNGPKDYCAIARRYAEQVVSGKIPACRWVRLACQRQIDDLARKDWHWRWDKKRAEKFCQLAELLPHVKGKWTTRAIVLEPWQCFFLTTIFGWVDDQGLRRFRKVLAVLPRKQSKSTLAAIIGLGLLTLDGEPGSEIYSAATTRDQAKISWGIAREMVARSPEFQQEFGIAALAHSITVESEGGTFKPLSRDADSLEGLNVHGVIIDELHAHPNREVFDVLDEATGSRQQPLMVIISTEGDDDSGIFAEQVKYGQDVLEGTHKDETYLCLYYTIDPGDDWTDPRSWYKAQPNLGVSVFLKDMEARCAQAIKNPASQASFLTKRLNVRMGAAEGFFNMLAFTSICKDPKLSLGDFYGQECIISLDMASTKDLTCKVLVFRRGRDYYGFSVSYLPGDAIERGKENYDRYRGWAKEGHLILTGESVTDYEKLESDLLEDRRNFRVMHVGIDPAYNAAEFMTRMMKEQVPIEPVTHNVTTFTGPMKTLDALITAGRFHHNGDPILTWAIGNVAVKPDVKGNVYPRKSRPENKIDPAVALIANFSLWQREQEQAPSVYELSSVI